MICKIPVVYLLVLWEGTDCGDTYEYCRDGQVVVLPVGSVGRGRYLWVLHFMILPFRAILW